MARTADIDLHITVFKLSYRAWQFEKFHASSSEIVSMLCVFFNAQNVAFFVIRLSYCASRHIFPCGQSRVPGCRINT